MAWKDLFSAQAPDYARFRPTYPAALFAWLAAVSPARRLALDVGAGSGQAARDLAESFDRVIALDPSRAQLASGELHVRVMPVVGSASALPVAAAAVDLIVSAQAFHWFDQRGFFAEIRRAGGPGAVLAVWCYGLSRVTAEVDAAVAELYEGHLGPYWEPERRLIEGGYRNVAFPFSPLDVPDFAMTSEWTFAQFIGYLSTWSPRKKYRAATGRDALEVMAPALAAAWGPEDQPRTVTWPLSVRAFRI